MRVKELREEHGWSMRDLAREAGVSLDTVQAMERGTRPHRPASLRKVANALGITVRKLKGHEPEQIVIDPSRLLAGLQESIGAGHAPTTSKGRHT